MPRQMKESNQTDTIRYTHSLEGVSASMLTGFFVGWPNPPSPDTHLRMLRHSYCAVLAIDERRNCVVGFITAISDGVLCAYIPLLEVLPEYQKQGIGTELVSALLSEWLIRRREGRKP